MKSFALALGAAVVQAGAHFEGPLDVRMLDDGFEMELLRDFVFVDSRGVRWEVPKKTMINGSDIPKQLWMFSGSPFTGKHRKASVPHDLYCRIRERTWQETHRMYFEACIIAGVSDSEAKRKLWGMMRFGPRW